MNIQNVYLQTKDTSDDNDTNKKKIMLKAFLLLITLGTNDACLLLSLSEDGFEYILDLQ